ncbi:MAG: hypothetical protein GC159_19980 [Phycisphaera sp.]|nr:hypothetical protein [Phycisphaera sp.]
MSDTNPHIPHDAPRGEQSDDDRFDRLCVRYYEGVADEAEVAELDAALAADALRREAFVAMGVHGSIIRSRLAEVLRAGADRDAVTADTPPVAIEIRDEVTAGNRPVGPPVTTTRTAHTLGRLTWARYAAAAALVIIAAVSVVLMRTRPSDDGDPSRGLVSPSGAVAVIADASGAEFDSGGALDVGAELEAGQIALRSGRVNMVMRRGAAVSVAGPASVELLGDNRCAVHAGRMTAYVPHSAAGFRTDLPHGLFVVDLGTEFAVRVADDGSSEVHVFDGVVELRGEAANIHPLKLPAGQAMRIDAHGRRARAVADAAGFTPRRRDLDLANAAFAAPALRPDTPWRNVIPDGWTATPRPLEGLGVQRNTDAPDTQHLFWNEPTGELTATVSDVVPAAGMTITLTCFVGAQNTGVCTFTPKLLVANRVVATRTDTIAGAGAPVESAPVSMTARTVRYTTTLADVGKPIGVRLAFAVVTPSIQARIDRVSLTVGGDAATDPDPQPATKE